VGEKKKVQGQGLSPAALEPRESSREKNTDGRGGGKFLLEWGAKRPANGGLTVVLSSLWGLGRRKTVTTVKIIQMYKKNEVAAPACKERAHNPCHYRPNGRNGEKKEMWDGGWEKA